MIRYRIKSKDGLLTVKVKILSNNIINTNELYYFSGNFFRGFLKPQVKSNNLIEYTGPAGVSLAERLYNSISKYEFFFIAEQIVDATLRLQKMQLRWDKVVWNFSYAFINEVTKELRLIYLPIENKTEDSSVVNFLDNLIYSAKPFDAKDPNFLQKFFYFIRSLGGYNPNKIEEYIKKECPEAVMMIKKFTSDGRAATLSSQTGGLDGLIGGGQQAGFSSNDNGSTALLNETKVTGYSSTDEDATGLLSGTQTTEYSGNAELSQSEETGLLLEDGRVLPFGVKQEDCTVYPTLFRLSTNEKISINKPVFRLGKEKSYVDYFVSNNIVVSRSHADIITRGKKYFIKDLNSKNHTYINGRMIQPQTEAEIQSGDRIRLGNEEFEFNI